MFVISLHPGNGTYIASLWLWENNILFSGYSTW